jgi:hypothetical protein
MGNSLKMCPDISKDALAIYKALEMCLFVTAFTSISPKLTVIYKDIKYEI